MCDERAKRKRSAMSNEIFLFFSFSIPSHLPAIRSRCVYKSSANINRAGRVKLKLFIAAQAKQIARRGSPESNWTLKSFATTVKIIIEFSFRLMMFSVSDVFFLPSLLFLFLFLQFCPTRIQKSAVAVQSIRLATKFTLIAHRADQSQPSI